jgi:hypothetical protein
VIVEIILSILLIVMSVIVWVQGNEIARLEDKLRVDAMRRHPATRQYEGACRHE